MKHELSVSSCVFLMENSIDISIGQRNELVVLREAGATENSKQTTLASADKQLSNSNQPIEPYINKTTRIKMNKNP
jgi:hypothetical protein